MHDSGDSGLLSLPLPLVENILSYLSYEQLSAVRLVCRAFNNMAATLLNRGFRNLEKILCELQRSVREHLPRRESERRSHPLARQADIVAALETRQSLLAMTFEKHIEMGRVCFFAGRVLDEFYRVVKLVRQAEADHARAIAQPDIAPLPNSPPRTHEVLQELRDISSMAMEYFEYKIIPDLLQKERHAASSSHVRSDDLDDDLSGGVASDSDEVSALPVLHLHHPSITLARIQDLGRAMHTAQSGHVSSTNRERNGSELAIASLRNQVNRQRSQMNELMAKNSELERTLQVHNARITQLESLVLSRRPEIGEKEVGQPSTLSFASCSSSSSSTSSRLLRSRQKRRSDDTKLVETKDKRARRDFD